MMIHLIQDGIDLEDLFKHAAVPVTAGERGEGPTSPLDNPQPESRSPSHVSGGQRRAMGRKRGYVIRHCYKDSVDSVDSPIVTGCPQPPSVSNRKAINQSCFPAGISSRDPKHAAGGQQRIMGREGGNWASCFKVPCWPQPPKSLES